MGRSRFLRMGVPGGGGNFNLNSISWDLWAEADRTLYQDSAKITLAAADGDPVGAVANAGGSGVDLLQSGVNTLKPTLKLNITGGRGGLRFDGGDYLSGSFVPPGTSGSVIIVFKRTGTATYQQLLTVTNGANLNEYVSFKILLVAGSYYLNVEQKNNITGAQFRGSTAIDTNYHIAVFRSSGTAYSISLDGADETLVTIAGTNTGDWFADTANLSLTNLGALNYGTVIHQFTGDMCAALYKSALSEAHENAAVSFLAEKYGITLNP